MPTFSDRSMKRLQTCDQRLQILMAEVIKERDCTILCGYRSPEEQEQAFHDGRSKAHYGQSKHNTYPSSAVDVMPYPIDWNDIDRLKDFANFVLGKASELNIPVRWGGNFKNFFDGPHFELEG